MGSFFIGEAIRPSGAFGTVRRSASPVKELRALFSKRGGPRPKAPLPSALWEPSSPAWTKSCARTSKQESSSGSSTAFHGQGIREVEVVTDADPFLEKETPAATGTEVARQRDRSSSTPSGSNCVINCVAFMALAALMAAFSLLHIQLIRHLCMERVGEPDCVRLWGRKSDTAVPSPTP